MITKKAEIDAYTKTWYSNLEESYLSPPECERLALVMAFLQPFHRATLETEGDNATIDCILLTMDVSSIQKNSQNASLVFATFRTKRIC